MQDLEAWIKYYEGYKAFPYKDTTGNITIGWGRNLDGVGISVDEAQLMFNNDIGHAKRALQNQLFFVDQPEGVQMALINMCFNMGISKLKTFVKMIDALIHKNYTLAAMEALESNWAAQVGQRAKDVALVIREGK